MIHCIHIGMKLSEKYPDSACKQFIKKFSNNICYNITDIYWTTKWKLGCGTAHQCFQNSLRYGVTTQATLVCNLLFPSGNDLLCLDITISNPH